MLNLEINNFKINKLPILTLDDISNVYIGKPNLCMCGCSGTYFYNPANRELSQQRRGYDITDNEISLEKVTFVWNKLKKATDIEVVMGSDKEYIFSIIIGRKQYTLYTI
jgi:hypothetical protein